MSPKKKKPIWVCGIDEVGRGPIAGPVTVGLVVYRHKDTQMFRSIPLLDSKKLSKQKRELIYRRLQVLKKEGKVFFVTASVGAMEIDKIGIAVAIRTCIKKVFHKIKPEEVQPLLVEVKLDGGLYAPDRFVNQETIIKGDTKERSISLASIVAKVTRDRYMVGQSLNFPEYGFDQHKGYGTREHYKALKKHGFCPLHRRSFLKKLG